MKKLYFLLFIFSFSFFTCSAQISQEVLALGGTGVDWGSSVIQTFDGGYAIAGYTNSFGAGGYDVYFVKIDSAGNVVWKKTIGGIYDDEGYGIVQTNDSGYVIAGYTGSFGAGNQDVYVIKFNKAGNLLWTKVIGGAVSDEAYAIIKTKDNGFALAGRTNSFGLASGGNFYIIRLDSAGNVKWTKTIGGINQEYAYAITNCSDGGFAATGFTAEYGMGRNDVYVVKLDSNGNLQWTETFGGVNQDWGYAILQTSDHGYMVGGITMSYGAGSQDDYLIKLDSTGALQWTTTIGGSTVEGVESMVQTKDKGFALGGYTASFGAGNDDFYLVKTDSMGNVQWTKTIGGGGFDDAYSVIQTKDGGYAMTGRTTSYGAGGNDLFFVKLDSNGNTCITSGSGGLVGNGAGVSSGGSVTSTDSGRVASNAIIDSGGTLHDVCNIILNNGNLPSNQPNYSLYPNPNHGVFTIQETEFRSQNSEFEIYNMLGEKIYSKSLNIEHSTPTFQSGQAFNINLSNQPAGIYMYRIIDADGKQTATGKFIIE